MVSKPPLFFLCVWFEVSKGAWFFQTDKIGHNFAKTIGPWGLPSIRSKALMQAFGLCLQFPAIRQRAFALGKDVPAYGILIQLPSYPY
jgi:hypothetical protein